MLCDLTHVETTSNRWCTQLTVVCVIKEYNLRNGLIPPHRLHVSGQRATATNEDELHTIYTHIVRWRHGDDGWLRGQNHVPERSAFIHYLLDHVTGGHLHWHCDGRRRIRRHHRHSHRPCNGALHHISHELTAAEWHKDSKYTIGTVTGPAMEHYITLAVNWPLLNDTKTVSTNRLQSRKACLLFYPQSSVCQS
jgi:hypothetical protein